MKIFNIGTVVIVVLCALSIIGYADKSIASSDIGDNMVVRDTDEYTGKVSYVHRDQRIELNNSMALVIMGIDDLGDGDKTLGIVVVYGGNDYLALDTLSYEVITDDGGMQSGLIRLSDIEWLRQVSVGADYESIGLVVSMVSGGHVVDCDVADVYADHIFVLEDIINARKMRLTLSGDYGRCSYELDADELRIIQETIAVYLSL